MYWDVVCDESAENPVEPAEVMAYHVHLDGEDDEEQAEVWIEDIILHLAFDEAAGGGCWGGERNLEYFVNLEYSVCLEHFELGVLCELGVWLTCLST